MIKFDHSYYPFLTPLIIMASNYFNHKGVSSLYPPMVEVSPPEWSIMQPSLDFAGPTFGHLIESHSLTDRHRMFQIINGYGSNPYKVTIRCLECDIKFTLSSHPDESMYTTNAKNLLLPIMQSDTILDQIKRVFQHLDLKGCHTITYLTVTKIQD